VAERRVFLYKYSFKQKLFNKMTNSKIKLSELPKAALLAALAGVIINAILFFIGSSAGIMDPAIGLPKPDGSVEAITVVPVIISSIIPVVVAALVLVLLNRFTANPVRIFGIITLVLSVLSFMNPFMGIPNVSTGMAMWLNLMHVVVAGCVWYFFSRVPRAEA
jgi:Family of unknown function (DUF6069)